METTALSTRPGGELTELEQIIAEEMQHDEHSYIYQPIRYGIVSEVGRFKNLSDEGELLSTMEGVILMSRIQRAYWEPSADDEDRRPRCVSKDGVTGEWRCDDDTSRVIRCCSCDKNQWGSERKKDPSGVLIPGRGKACKEMRRFLILRAGYDVPVILTIPPTSCRAFDQYASALRTRRSAYYAVETCIGLEKATSQDGYRYSVTTFKPLGNLDTDMVRWITTLRRQFEEALGIAPEYEEYYDDGHRDADQPWPEEDAPWPEEPTD